ncbi:TRAP transporter small permease subunit [Salinisphaera sp. LB1]|uniref:TRAP transporter small permease subunit n=1 Tax=Salinisphaera sp. LB1 TaxID=2183911 RepID=UPI000D7D59E6|nr:TRAP transporter small permease subunit [Salinisphaera sp. LB1]AWN16828.1 TRAP dicarboxylate transporter, DctQ subunit, unknown substrate 6 [Salinisphaera sp. LB1]
MHMSIQFFSQSLGRLADGIDGGIHWMGRICAWLTLVLVLLVASDVLARYIWHVGSVAEQQLEWHLLAVVAMLSAPFTLQQDEHVRVDIFYQSFSEPTRRRINILVCFLIIIPTSVFIAYVSMRFVTMAYQMGEGSATPGGLPDRFLLKAFVPLGFVLIALEGMALGIRALIPRQQAMHGR